MVSGSIRDPSERQGARGRGTAAGQGAVLDHFWQLFFPLASNVGRKCRGTPWDLSLAISVGARRLPLRAKTFLCHQQGGTGGEHRAGGRRQKKRKFFLFFSGAGRYSRSARISILNRPFGGPTAVGERGGGRDAGGSAVDKGVVLFRIRATDDSLS